MEWNVYNEIDQKIETYNIFKSAHFVKSLIDMFKDIKKEDKKYREEHGYGMDNYKWSNKDEIKAINFIDDFSDKRLNSECQYQFWGRCEYEFFLTDWPPSIDREEVYRLVDEDKNYFDKYGTNAYRFTPNLCVGKKINIYDQLRLNWQQFKKYVFDNEKEIKKLYKNEYKRYFKE